MSHGNVVIVGSGIIGIAHAITAREFGWNVTVIERDGRPLGASVRNFGALWPIGCRPGPERAQALEGVARWKKLSAQAGFELRQEGSLSLAYRDEAWEVLKQFTDANPDSEGFELIPAGRVTNRFPAVQPQGLRGALFSSTEALVHSPTALPALVKFAARLGVAFHFGTTAIRALEDAVEVSDGRRFPFDHLVIAAGEEIRLLFPEAIAAGNVTRCRLQMMRTAPLKPGFKLGATLVSDLTLCHYPAFRDCPATARLKERIEAELPLHREWGVHVIAAQHADGSVVIGDSHEYAEDFSPELLADVEELILDALQVFTRLPSLKIAARWQGVYLKSTEGRTQVVLKPRDRVTLVTAMGGLGMTLSWGLARQTVSSWSSPRRTPDAAPITQ